MWHWGDEGGWNFHHGSPVMRPVRGAGWRGKGRGLQNPHSLFPGEEKENAPFDGVREKGSGGGIPDFVRNARSACYVGFGLVETCGLCPFNQIRQLQKLGSRPDALPFSFAAAPRHFERAWHCSFDTHRIASAKKKQGLSGSAPSTKLRQLPGCGSKTGAGGIRERPQLTKLPYAVEWSKALESAPQ